MLKKIMAGGVTILVACATMVGCSTAPRRQEPVATYVPPAPVATVPAQTQAELDALKQQVTEQQSALAQSDAEKRELEDRLNAALASKTTVSKKAEDSYLK